MNRLLITILCMLPYFAWGCSFAQVTELFAVNPGQGNKPQKPEFSVKEIKRGTNDGQQFSCSDAGVITLQLNNKSNENLGYIFTLENGQFEDKLFQDEPIVATEYYAKLNEYRFVWLDGSTIEQEPFEITVKVIAISKTGQASEPALVSISHPGVKKPWWRFW